MPAIEVNKKSSLIKGTIYNRVTTQVDLFDKIKKAPRLGRIVAVPPMFDQKDPLYICNADSAARPTSIQPAVREGTSLHIFN